MIYTGKVTYALLFYKCLLGVSRPEITIAEEKRAGRHICLVVH